MTISTVNVAYRLSTEYDKHLPAYDYTFLSSINTCPTFGILRYQMAKTMIEPGKRALALELGGAMHEAFAALRLVTLAKKQKLRKHAEYHAARLFGVENGADIIRTIARESDFDQAAISTALTAFTLSGYTDDERDKNRTCANAQEALINYAHECEEWKQPVYVQDVKKPMSLVGIEIVFDIVISFILDTPTFRAFTAMAHVLPECIKRVQHGRTRGYEISIRYIGRIDGLHQHGDRLINHENKTAGRLNEAWQESYAMSHQVTGYAVAASLIAGQPINTSYVIGLQVPQRRTSFTNLVIIHCHREQHNIASWLQWVLHTLSIEWQYNNDPINAPKYTGSCNRYFRPCMFIPFCYGNDDERAAMIGEMATDRWSPLHEVSATIDT